MIIVFPNITIFILISGKKTASGAPLPGAILPSRMKPAEPSAGNKKT